VVARGGARGLVSDGVMHHDTAAQERREFYRLTRVGRFNCVIFLGIREVYGMIER
jgi:hypothetical protein